MRAWKRSVAALWALAVPLFVLGSGSSRACDMDVREAGFLTQAGQPYEPGRCQFWYVCRKPTSQDRAYVVALQKLCRDGHVNLEPVLIDVSRLSPSMLKSLAQRKIDVAKLPVSALPDLVGERGTYMKMPGKMPEARLRTLINSSLRTRLRDLLADSSNYCAIVFSPGPDVGESQRARAEIGWLWVKTGSGRVTSNRPFGRSHLRPAHC